MSIGTNISIGSYCSLPYTLNFTTDIGSIHSDITITLHQCHLEALLWTLLVCWCGWRGCVCHHKVCVFLVVCFDLCGGAKTFYVCIPYTIFSSYQSAPSMKSFNLVSESTLSFQILLIFTYYLSRSEWFSLHLHSNIKRFDQRIQQLVETVWTNT